MEVIRYHLYDHFTGSFSPDLSSIGGEDYMDVVDSASDDEEGLLQVCNDTTGESEVRCPFLKNHFSYFFSFA